MQRANGIVLYDGPSQLNRQPVVAIATGFFDPITNRKTGPMIQVYILMRDLHPVDALSTGADSGICANCELRPKITTGTGFKERACYVPLNGVMSVWQTFRRGRYPFVPLEDYAAWFTHRKVRFGAYGDPTAIPLEYWRGIANVARGWTGYTHQWRAKRFEGFKDLCMASVETPEQALLARAKGWATFGVLPAGAPIPEGVLHCPASTLDSGVQCMDCMTCNGRGSSVAIHAHGNGAKHVLHSV